MSTVDPNDEYVAGLRLGATAATDRTSGYAAG
jgi:hypothetical protein